jgi:glycine dehydrogenase subunit 1
VPYIPNTDADVKEMLQAVNCKSLEELWRKAQIKDEPPALENILPGKSEYEVTLHLNALASQNATNLVNFVGSGYYDHLIPAAVGALTGRSEFYTAYTPYQPEASQGTLRPYTSSSPQYAGLLQCPWRMLPYTTGEQPFSRP